jgi:DNA-binding SARP family transcriptional activator
MADLWPDLDNASASRNLRVTLAYLQSVLEPDRSDLDAPYFLRSSGGTLTLVVDEYLVIDSRMFERSLDEAGRLERQGVPSAALMAYERAVETWHGDFFEGLRSERWLQLERDRLRGHLVSAALRAADLELARGDCERALALAEKALASDPWSENAYQAIVAAYLETRDLPHARRALRRCQLMLQDLGVAAEHRTLTLARQVAASH